MLGLGDILLSMLASLSPFSLTGIINLSYKKKKKEREKKVIPIFFTPSHLSRSQKLAPMPATQSQLLWWEGEGRHQASCLSSSSSRCPPLPLWQPFSREH